MSFVIFIWILPSMILSGVFTGNDAARGMKNSRRLHLVRFEVPEFAPLGNSVTLVCNYAANNRPIYSAKWYKDGVEFISYVPLESTFIKVFDVPGVNILLEESTFSSVKLVNVNHKTQGTYRCEVSSEAPYFQTVAEQSNMEVAELPSVPPFISGGRPIYSEVGYINLNCISEPSYPASTLYWVVNNAQITDKEYLRGPTVIRNPHSQLLTTTLGLRMFLEDEHVKNGSVNFKCVSKIGRIYESETEHTATLTAGSVYPDIVIDEPSGTSKSNNENTSCDKYKSYAWPSTLLFLLMHLF